jgi:hypothetical protein
MMPIKDIKAILKCSEDKARRVVEKANVIVTKKHFAHGRKNLYAVTPEQLPQMLEDYHKKPEQMSMQQDDALSALESALNRRGFKGEQHAAV